MVRMSAHLSLTRSDGQRRRREHDDSLQRIWPPAPGQAHAVRAGHEQGVRHELLQAEHAGQTARGLQELQRADEGRRGRGRAIRFSEILSDFCS